MAVSAADGFHVGDVDTELVVECQDENEDPIDVSGATLKFIYLTNPNGVVTEYAAEFDDDGTDGLIKYKTVAGDFSTDGSWSIQGWVDIGTPEFSAKTFYFEVLPSARYPNGDNR